MGMARPYVFAFVVIGPACVLAGCFPDYQVGDGTSNGGDGGGAGDGAGTSDGGDATTDGGGNGDGQPPGDGGDGGAFDAAASKLVPLGSFVFTDPSGSTMTTATLSHDVYFDTHELTVATLRAWVAAAKPFPCAGASCPLDPGGPYASKIVWYPAWNQFVAKEDYKDPSCQAAGISQQGFPTYNGTDDTVPANCLNWYQAAALCWFDGGKRLPTQVEWQYEATGRGRGRTYPWGDTPVPSDCSRAIWRNDGGSFQNFDGAAFRSKSAARRWARRSTASTTWPEASPSGRGIGTTTRIHRRGRRIGPDRRRTRAATFRRSSAVETGTRRRTSFERTSSRRTARPSRSAMSACGV